MRKDKKTNLVIDWLEDVVTGAFGVFLFVSLGLGIFIGGLLLGDPLELFKDSQLNFILGIIVFNTPYFLFMLIASLAFPEWPAFKVIGSLLTIISTAGLITMTIGISIEGGCTLFTTPKVFEGGPYGLFLIIIGTLVAGIFAPFGGKGVTERLLIKLAVFLKDLSSK